MMNMRVFITDVEGPISKNDNAFELSCSFIPNGDKLFTLISKYDDVIADVLRRPGYKAGNTLKLILPFLKAYGVINEKMQKFSINSMLLVPGAIDTLHFISKIMPSFIVSTSYEHYIRALCDLTGFPYENAYCTRVDIDKYLMSEDELIRIKELRKEIVSMPMIEIPKGASSLDDFSQRDREVIRRLDEIFWDEILKMKCGAALIEVKPVGGEDKASAILDIISKLGVSVHNVMYVGDSITDVQAFRLVKEGGGLAISFNGNEYAIREAEIAILSDNTIVTSILADVFNRLGKKSVIEMVEEWSPSALERFNVDSLLRKRILELYGEKFPKVEVITPKNRERLSIESSAFRKKVRGEAIGRLG